MKKKVASNKVAKNHFLPMEDEKIKELVLVYGMKDWKAISMHLNNRSARQVRERWKCYLAPSIKNSPWTGEEDALLEEQVNQKGTKWAKIASSFGQRTDINIKNRWLLIQRLHNRENQSNHVLKPEKKQRIDNNEINELEEGLKSDLQSLSEQNRLNEELCSNQMDNLWEDAKWGFSEK